MSKPSPSARCKIGLPVQSRKSRGKALRRGLPAPVAREGPGCSCSETSRRPGRAVLGVLGIRSPGPASTGQSGAGGHQVSARGSQCYGLTGRPVHHPPLGPALSRTAPRPSADSHRPCTGAKPRLGPVQFPTPARSVVSAKIFFQCMCVPKPPGLGHSTRTSNQT